MRPWTRRTVLVFALVVALLLLPRVAGPHIRSGERSPDDRVPFARHLKRPYYPLRHWQWSGIMPFFGGFHPDPHFLTSDMATFPEVTSRRLGLTRIDYLLADVNPYFNDETSEVVLLLQADKRVTEYLLEVPRNQNVQAIVFWPTRPDLLPFTSGNQVVLLSGIDGTRGLFLLDAPLHGGRLALVPARTTRFYTLASAFTNAADADVRAQFCDSRRRDFVAFYEFYAHPCDDRRPAKPEIEKEFREFWGP